MTWSRRVERRFWPVLAGFLLLLGSVAAVHAQDEDFVPEESGPVEAEERFENIDDLLLQEEEVLSNPDIYTYDPGERRDPFRSLIKTRSAAVQELERPEGVPGLLIDEVEIQGVFMTEDGPVAQVESASQDASYLLRPGDQLWDGDVVRITINEVVFKQSISDPTALKPFRDVVKKLNP